MGFGSKVRRWARFHNNTAGTVGVLFALSAIPFIFVAGSAMDYIQASDVKSKLQSALDAAALAAAIGGDLTDAERVALANTAFEKNFTAAKTAGLSTTPVFTINGEKVVGQANVVMNTNFVRIAGINTMDLNAGVTINIPQLKNIEVSLVLDFSGSMKDKVGGEVKYTAMQAAATDLINDLGVTGKAKFALVPFSHHVYLSMPNKYVSGQPLTGTWTGCTQDRTYSYNLTDGTPNSADDTTKWGQPQAPIHISSGCSGYSSNNLTLVPLTSDIDTVTAKLGAMKPYAWTHIPLGLEFGWQTLSPNGIFGATVAPYNDPHTNKWIVLLTDGAQTEPAFGPGSTRTVAQGDSNLTALCGNIKDKGVKIVTVAYDLDDAATVDRLKECSSLNDDGEHMFYQPGNSTPISAVFADIKKQLAEAIFISK